MSKAEQLAHKLDFEYADNGAGYNTEWTKVLQEAAALLRTQDALLRQALDALEDAGEYAEYELRDRKELYQNYPNMAYKYRTEQASVDLVNKTIDAIKEHLK